VRDQQNQAQIVSDIAKLGLPARVCERDARQIVSNISELTSTRPTWAVRMQEQDANLRLRGPVPKTLDTLMRQYPYHARLPNYQPTAEVKKRRLFDGWFGRGR
jgi:hypothetical protein